MVVRSKLKRKAVGGTADPGARDTQHVQADESGNAFEPMAWSQSLGMVMWPAAIAQWWAEQQHALPPDTKSGERPPGIRAASSATSVKPAPIDRRICLD